MLTGCSGGGKSSILAGLAVRGRAVVPEAGRELVREQLAAGGDALPWMDAECFALLLAERAIRQFNAVRSGLTIFDRGLIDATSFLEHLGKPVPETLRAAIDAHRYAAVFVTPPWQEIFTTDAERRKSFADAVAEHEALMQGYESAGYALREVPRGTVDRCVRFMEAQLTDIETR